MKSFILLILIFLTSLHYSFSQNISSNELARGTIFNTFNSPDPYTGLWRITNAGLKNENQQNLLYTWQYVQTPITSQIMRVFFVDTLHGWAGHNSNGAMRSTDGGFNWTLISFADTNFTTLYQGTWFINQSTGWMVGGSLQIRKTTDGGVTWFKQTPPSVAGIFHSIQFFDANTGIAIGSKSYPFIPFIAKSTNSGQNWAELNDAFSGAQELNNMYWFNSSTGWIAGYNVLLYTTNGGQNFTNLFSNVPPTGNGYNDLLSIWFVNQQTGWIGGSNLDKQNIYKTTNAGANWVFQTNPVSVNNYYVQINDIAFMTPDSGWAIHGTPVTGAIMFTTNGGTNWVIENGTANWFQSISVYNRLKAWVGGSSGLMWYTYLTITRLTRNNNEIPEHFALYQNYPNPFNPTTKIKFTLPASPNPSKGGELSVHISIYDILGRRVAEIIPPLRGGQEGLPPGNYEITWDGSNFPSGVYYYRLTAGDFTDVKKMILIK